MKYLVCKCNLCGKILPHEKYFETHLINQSVVLPDKVFEFPDNIQKEEVEKVNTRETRSTKTTSQAATKEFACEVCGQVSIQTEDRKFTQHECIRKPVRVVDYHGFYFYSF